MSGRSHAGAGFRTLRLWLAKARQGTPPVKSFRLYLQAPIATPKRFVTDYSPAELSRLREMFKPQAHRHRNWSRTGYIVIGIAFAFMLLGFVLQNISLHWTQRVILGGFLACWITLMIIAFLFPVPWCPGCHNRIDRGFGAFCPECGARSLERGSWCRAPHCSSCGRAMGRGKSRGYSIHACTHCGVKLDDAGL